MTLIPIKYVGQQDTWQDHLYGSGETFHKGKTAQVPAWLAASLLQHPEFEDRRPAGQRSLRIVAERPVTKDPVEEMRELQEIETQVRLDTMTKAQLATHAMRAFGVRVDLSDPKVDVIGSVRTLTRQRAA
jgi:hypothetical protein